VIAIIVFVGGWVSGQWSALRGRPEITESVVGPSA
jgi:hypothetical protein